MRLSETEWAVMDRVWERGKARAREVHGDLSASRGWAYTTVKTLLDRLAAKGALRAVPSGRSTEFVPAVTRAKARRTEVKGLLERAFDGATAPLLRFVVENGDLPDRERRDLLRVLRREEARERRGKEGAR
jgi:BlaI family penicillinase repressor